MSKSTYPQELQDFEFGRLYTTIEEHESLDSQKMTDVTQFTPVQLELEKLVQLWMQMYIDTHSDVVFRYVHMKSSVSFALSEAIRRLNAIHQAIGDEAYERAVKEAEKIQRRIMGDRRWNLYKNGTPEELKAYIDELHGGGNKQGRSPDPHEPLFNLATDELAVLAVQRFGELSLARIAEALRCAAQRVEGHHWTLPRCNHRWAVDGSHIHFDRCDQCGALRQRG